MRCGGGLQGWVGEYDENTEGDRDRERPCRTSRSCYDVTVSLFRCKRSCSVTQLQNAVRDFWDAIKKNNQWVCCELNRRDPTCPSPTCRNVFVYFLWLLIRGTCSWLLHMALWNRTLKNKLFFTSGARSGCCRLPSMLRGGVAWDDPRPELTSWARAAFHTSVCRFLMAEKDSDARNMWLI